MAAARSMPGVCAVLVSSSPARTTRTPSYFQFVVPSVAIRRPAPCPSVRCYHRPGRGARCDRRRRQCEMAAAAGGGWSCGDTEGTVERRGGVLCYEGIRSAAECVRGDTFAGSRIRLEFITAHSLRRILRKTEASPPAAHGSVRRRGEDCYIHHPIHDAHRRSERGSCCRCCSFPRPFQQGGAG